MKYLEEQSHISLQTDEAGCRDTCYPGVSSCGKNSVHTEQELTQAMEDYIRFYNTERRQEKLNGLAPIGFRKQAGKDIG